MRNPSVLYIVNVLIPYLVNFMPLIVTALGWLKAYQSRRVQSLHPFALTLLVVVTALAAVPAGAFIYFDELRPVHYVPPWQDPLVLLYGWFCLLGPFSMVLGFLAYRKEPKWLFWVLEVASICLTGLGALAVMAY
jgi:hypothetical protein